MTTTLGINHLLKRFPRELSNGQRQRVALGRVLVRPADIYLLDEPLSHLDAKLRAAMRAELKQLGAMSKTTTLYVTHDYQEALALGDRIAVMREGSLVQIGTPRGDLAAGRPTPSSPVRSGSRRSTSSTVWSTTARIRLGGRLVRRAGARRRDRRCRGDRVRVGLRPCDIHVHRRRRRTARLRRHGGAGRAARPQRRADRRRRRRAVDRPGLRAAKASTRVHGSSMTVADDGRARLRRRRRRHPRGWVRTTRLLEAAQ